MKFQFTEENLRKVEAAIAKYPQKKAAVMPVLYIVQEQHGWISGEAMTEVARILEMTQEEVLGVVTFYTMYHKKPAGKYHIQVCTNVSCMLRGGYDIYNAVRDKLKLENGGVSEDMLFSLEEVECMGSCGTAPMIAVNEDYHENIDTEKTLQILDSLK
ncbi:MAG: NADH-quinone oxidoreductase subunit NuoE [Ignavibacteriales bacterium]|nr:NADH-quinone oxidoreductase subunit 2 [Ignavibacteriaceae bacterium]QOJ29579.1 MAG: NADH-quinone oxidoreductase subunit NuoE [Ignavibacteriales bacterium]